MDHDHIAEGEGRGPLTRDCVERLRAVGYGRVVSVQHERVCCLRNVQQDIPSPRKTEVHGGTDRTHSAICSPKLFQYLRRLVARRVIEDEDGSLLVWRKEIERRQRTTNGGGQEPGVV